MTPVERRWKWVKKEALPTDLVQLMDKLTKKKKNKDEKADGEEDESKPKEREKVEKEEFLTKIKRDYLTEDFTVIMNVKEVLGLLKEERLKSKYSAEYHAEVLKKITENMPCATPEEIKMKIEVII